MVRLSVGALKLFFFHYKKMLSVSQDFTFGSEHELFTHTSNTVGKNVTLHLNLKSSPRETADNGPHVLNSAKSYLTFSPSVPWQLL